MVRSSNNSKSKKKVKKRKRQKSISHRNLFDDNFEGGTRELKRKTTKDKINTFFQDGHIMLDSESDDNSDSNGH